MTNDQSAPFHPASAAPPAPTPDPPAEPALAPPPREPEPTLALARLLRGAGAVLLLASALTFLLQRWSHGGDIAKYGLLVAQTLVVVAAAFVCAVRVQESRGARTFLAIALGTLPVHFTVLGAFVYSRVSLDPITVDVPSQARWVAPSDVAALFTVLGSLTVLIPVALLSLLSLVRSEARRLLPLVLALNALLLVPVRSPDVVGVGIALAVALLARLEAGWFAGSVAMRTPEGRIVRALLAAPVALLAARAIWLYSPTLPFIGLCLIALGAALFTFAPRLEADGARVVQRLATAVTGAGWGAIALELVGHHTFPASLVLPTFGLPLAALLLGVSRVAAEDGPGYRHLARIFAFATVTGNLLGHHGVGPAWLSLVVGIALLAAGTYRKRFGDVLAGSVAAIAGLAVQVHLALGLERWLSWGSLSLLGVSLVFLAAFLERHPERLAAFLGTRLRERPGAR